MPAVNSSVAALLLIVAGVYLLSYVSYQDMLVEAAAKAAKAAADAEAAANGEPAASVSDAASANVGDVEDNNDTVVHPSVVGADVDEEVLVELFDDGDVNGGATGKATQRKAEAAAHRHSHDHDDKHHDHGHHSHDHAHHDHAAEDGEAVNEQEGGGHGQAAHDNAVHAKHLAADAHLLSAVNGPAVRVQECVVTHVACRVCVCQHMVLGDAFGAARVSPGTSSTHSRGAGCFHTWC